MTRNESRQFHMSVEGVNCEKLYFEHLAKLINTSGRNQYNLKISPRAMTPMQYAKRNAYRPVDRSHGKDLPYIHIQDIEDYYNTHQLQKFYGMIDEMRKAEREFRISYRLGYSNYTFELWMLLHVTDMTSSVSNRTAYLRPINQYFHRNYSSLNEFKNADEFQKILDGFITLDTVFDAIKRANRIVENNVGQNKRKATYRRITFFQDNPDVTVHEVVQMILDVCAVK